MTEPLRRDQPGVRELETRVSQILADADMRIEAEEAAAELAEDAAPGAA